MAQPSTHQVSQNTQSIATDNKAEQLAFQDLVNSGSPTPSTSQHDVPATSTTTLGLIPVLQMLPINVLQDNVWNFWEANDKASQPTWRLVSKAAKEMANQMVTKISFSALSSDGAVSLAASIFKQLPQCSTLSMDLSTCEDVELQLVLFLIDCGTSLRRVTDLILHTLGALVLTLSTATLAAGMMPNLLSIQTKRPNLVVKSPHVITALGACKHLQRLDLAVESFCSPQVHSVLSNLVCFERLISLSLEPKRVSDHQAVALSAVSKLTSLQHLHIADGLEPSILGSTLTLLVPLVNLNHLDIKCEGALGIEHSTAVLNNLRTLKKLQTVSFSGLQILVDDEGYQALQSLPDLTQIRFARMHLIQDFTPLPSLRMLALHFSTQDELCRLLSIARPPCSLDCHCLSVVATSEDQIPVVAKQLQLVADALEAYSFSGSSVEILMLAGFADVRVPLATLLAGVERPLDCFYCLHITSFPDPATSFLEELVRCLPNLWQATFTKLPAIADTSLVHLCKLRHLQSLRFMQCGELTSNGLLMLAASAKNNMRINVTGVSASECTRLNDILKTYGKSSRVFTD